MKFLKWTAISFTLLLALLFITRLIGLWMYFKVPTVANEPTLKLGSSFIASRFKEPKRLDFVCFLGQTPFGKQFRVFRLCGVSGDTIEIKNGSLFINGKNVDHNLNLKHKYLTTAEQYDLITSIVFTDDANVYRTSNDSVFMSLSDSFIVNNNLQLKRIIMPPSEVDTAIQAAYHKNWNSDNFGPLIIPENKYFVLGDNRNNAFDSRYIGLIDINDYRSTVIKF